MEDIKLLIGGDIEFQYKDVTVISDVEEIKQNIKLESITIEGDCWYDLDFGWSLFEFLQRPTDEMLKLELQERIISKLSKRDEIEKNTISVEFMDGDESLIIKIKLVILGEITDITVTLGRLNVTVE